MLRELVNRINMLSKPARYMMYIGIISGMLLLSAALLLSLKNGRGVEDIYLSCDMSKTAATLFSEGVVSGLAYEFISGIKGK